MVHGAYRGHDTSLLHIGLEGRRAGCAVGTRMKAVTAALAMMFLIACVEVDQESPVVVKDETVAHLSRQLAQQDSDLDAFRALRLLVQAGQKGIDAIMVLDRAGTMNESVWRAVRRGTTGSDVCPQLPDFTACVQNAARRELGIPEGPGTLQISCRDLPQMRDAFLPEEFQGMMHDCAEADDTVPGFSEQPP